MSLLRKGRAQINRNTYYTNQITQQLGYQQGILPLLEHEKREFPTGLISAYMGATDPVGWLICDGRAVSRTSYPGLFSLLGVSYGVGDGIITFNLPDLRGSFLRGAGTNQSVSTNYVGPNLNAFQTHATEKHAHTITDPGHRHTFDTMNDDYNSTTGGYDTTPHTMLPSAANYDSGATQQWLNPIELGYTGITINDSLTSGNSNDHETRPFNCGVNWIIKI